MVASESQEWDLQKNNCINFIMASLDSLTVNDRIECVSMILVHMEHSSFRITLARIVPTGVILFIHNFTKQWPKVILLIK